MDPRTFLPAPALALGSPPALGDPAPALVVTLEPGRPAVVAFLRHTGCPFAEATLRAMRDAAVAGSAVQWVAVTHAPADATGRWCQGLGGSGGVRVVSDQSRRSYADWGLGQTTSRISWAADRCAPSRGWRAKGSATRTRPVHVGNRPGRSRSIAIGSCAGAICLSMQAISPTSKRRGRRSRDR